MPIGNYNFDIHSHQLLYENIHNEGLSPGSPAASNATDRGWKEFTEVMEQAEKNVRAAVRRAGAAWEGAASEKFSGAVAPLVQWAEDARAAGEQTHRSFCAQQDYYTSTRDSMPEPVEITSTANDDFLGIPAGLTHLLGGQTDQDVEEEQANEAKRVAVDLMEGYRIGASSAVFDLGTFTEPPKVVVQIVEPTSTTTSDERSDVREQNRENDERGSEQKAVNIVDDIGGATEKTPEKSAPDQVRNSAEEPERKLGPQEPVRAETQDASDRTTTSGTTTTARQPLTSPQATAPTGGPAHVPALQSPASGMLPPFSRSASSSGSGGSGPHGTGGTRTGTRTGNPERPGSPAGQQPGRGTPNVAAPRADAHGAGSDASSSRGATGGAQGAGASGPASQRGQGEEDSEHLSPEYLQEVDDPWGEDDMIAVPPVIGE